MEAFRYLKIVKALEPTEVYAQMILASGDIGMRALMGLCQRILHGNGMPEDLATCVTIPIFNGRGNIMNCGLQGGVKLLEHAIKIVEEVLDKSCNVDDMQFGFLPGRGTNDAVLFYGGYEKNT